MLKFIVRIDLHTLEEKSHFLNKCKWKKPTVQYILYHKDWYRVYPLSCTSIGTGKCTGNCALYCMHHEMLRKFACVLYRTSAKYLQVRWSYMWTNLQRSAYYICSSCIHSNLLIWRVISENGIRIRSLQVKVDKEIKGSSIISESFTSACIIICKYVSHMRFYEPSKFKTRMCELCTFSHILSR